MSVAAQLTPDQSQQIIYNTLRTVYALPDTISKIITAQTGHETAGWTSNVYNTFNNVAGYGYTGNGNYKYRDSIEQSIGDVVGWLGRHVPSFQDIVDTGTYATAIRNAGYYTDSESNYEGGLDRWYNDNLQLVAGGSVALIIAGVLLFLIFRKK